MDEAGVLCHGGAFDIPAVPFQGRFSNQQRLVMASRAEASKAVSNIIQDAQARNTPQLCLVCAAELPSTLDLFAASSVAGKVSHHSFAKILPRMPVPFLTSRNLRMGHVFYETHTNGAVAAEKHHAPSAAVPALTSEPLHTSAVHTSGWQHCSLV